MAGQCACGGKAVKAALMFFVALSVGAVVYKTASGPGKTGTAPAETASVAAEPPPPAKAGLKAPAVTAKKPAESVAEAKTAVVYYFYTNTRCSSCKTIEAYTREAVEKNFTAAYKGWKVIFRGVNVEEESGKHFVQDYRLNSKAVVVQKFSGEKALKWTMLEKIWQLLGDKEAFINYITGETHKLLDEK